MAQAGIELALSTLSRAKVRAVVFDLDGTLIDSRGDIARAANHALVEHGFVALPEEQIAHYVGDGARRLLVRAANIEPTDSLVELLYASFIGYYTQHPTELTTFCPGAEAALAALADMPLALCTNKPRITTERVLDGLGIARLFRVVSAGGDLPVHKPDPGPVLQVAAQLGLLPSELVMVGDGAQDVGAGRAAGAHTIGVLGGIQAEERLLAAEPEHLIHTLFELPELVRRLS